jgi:hypothetical protein
MKCFPMLVAVAGLLLPHSPLSGEPIDLDVLQTWLGRAKDSVARLEGSPTADHSNWRLCFVLARAGDIDGVLESAGRISSANRKIHALKAIAAVARAKGDEASCRRVVAEARSLEVNAASAFVLYRGVVDVCFAAGLPGDAVAYAEAAVPPMKGDRTVLFQVVECYASIGDRAAAEQFIIKHQLGDSNRHLIVHGLIQSKQLATASEVVKTIRDRKQADQARVQLAEAFARAGDFDAAMAQVSLIADEPARTRAHGQVDQVRSETMPLDELQRYFAAATLRDAKSGMLAQLVQRLVKKGEFSLADQAIDETVAMIERDTRPDAKSKFGTYGDQSAITQARSWHFVIADAMVDKGMMAEAVIQLEKGSAPLDALPFSAFVVKSMTEMQRCRLLVKMNCIDEAIAHMERGVGPMRATMAGDIAVSLIRKGKVDEGLKLLPPTAVNEDPKSPLAAVGGEERGAVAAALLEAVGMDAALEYLTQIGESERGARAVEAFADAMLKQGEINDVDKLYTALNSTFIQAHLAISVATQMSWRKDE